MDGYHIINQIAEEMDILSRRSQVRFVEAGNMMFKA